MKLDLADEDLLVESIIPAVNRYGFILLGYVVMDAHIIARKRRVVQGITRHYQADRHGESFSWRSSSRGRLIATAS